MRLEKGLNGTREKTFRQRRPNGKDGYIESLGGVRRVPYRLPQLAVALEQEVHICEGEKDADTLAKLGLLSTSVAAPSNCDLEPFQGRTVYIHEDNDVSGRVKAAKLAEALAGKAAEIVIVRYVDAGEGGDVTDWLAKGNDLEAILLRCEDARRTRDTSAPALEFDTDITIDTRVDDIVKGLLRPGDHAVLYGPPAVGKTFVALDLGYHVAHGKDWHGHRVRQAPVLYVGLEGIRGLRHRIATYARHMGSAGKMFARLTIHTPLGKGDAGDVGQAAIIKEARNLATGAGKPVGIITIDTLARAIAGDDENSADAIAAFMERVSTIARETGAAVVVVHHPGKDENRGMRGHSILGGGLEVVMKVTTSAGKVREVVAAKVKDGEDGPLFSYRLKQVKLGIDDDGDEITSCVVEAVAQPKKEAQPPKPESSADRALTELEQLIIADRGVVARGHERAPDGAVLIKKSDWRDACRAKTLSDGVPGNEKKAFQRAVRTLASGNLIGDFGDEVWLIKSSNSV